MSKKTIYISLGSIFLGLGLLGAFLPILPTTPFILLSAYFYSHGSPKLHKWLLNSPMFGPVIKNWEENGSISMRAKILATISITLLFTYSLLILDKPLLIKVLLVVVAISILIFIWTRPTAPKEKLDTSSLS